MTATRATSALHRGAGPVVIPPSESSIALALQCARDLFNGKKGETSLIPNMPHSVDVKSFLTDVVFAARVWMGEGFANRSMGIFSFVTVLGSFFAVRQTTHQVKEAWRVGDGVGVVTRALSATDWTSRAVIGLSAVVDHVSAIYTKLTHAAASSLAGRVQLIASGTMDMAFGVTCTAIGIQGLIHTAELGCFGVKFETAGTDIERMELLMKEPEVDVKGWADKASKDPKAAEKLEKLALKALVKSLVAASQRAKTAEKISEAQAMRLYQTLIGSKGFQDRHRARLIEQLKLDPSQVEGLSLLALFGLVERARLKVALEQKKKSRLLSPEVRKTIDKMSDMNLVDRMRSGTYPEVQTMAQRECQELTKEVRIALCKKATLFLWIIALGALGTAFAAMAFMATVGVGAAPPLWLVIVFLFVMVAIDASYMHNALETAKPEKADYVLLAIGCLVVLSAFGLTVGLSLALHFSIVKAAIVTGTTLALAGYSYYRLRKREKEWKWENPTLQDFADLLKKQSAVGEVPEPVVKSFEALSKEDRQAIMGSYKKYGLRSWKYRNGIGSSYLRQLQDEKDIERYIRGVEEAAIAFWKEYRIKETKRGFEDAMSLQRFRDLIVDGKFAQAADYLETMRSAPCGRALAAVHELMRREESLEDLKEATTIAVNRQILKT